MSREAVAQTWSQGGYVFLQSAVSHLSTYVLTNGLSVIARLPLNLPIRPLPDGGFVGTGDTNHFVTKCDAQGSIDPNFSAPPFDPGAGLVDVAGQQDGKIVIASSQFPFVTSYQGSGLFRLNTDGSHDESFHVIGTVLGQRVLVQPDGKILVLTRGSVLRFLQDGSVDPNFSVPQFDNYCRDFGLQLDGKIIVEGDFSKVDGANRPWLVRLTPSGSVDFSFGPVTNPLGGFLRMALQSNGDIVVTQGVGVRRYLSDGRLDRRFTPPNSGERIEGVGVDQADKIIYNYGNDSTFVLYSGRRRIRSSGASFDQVLEQSSSVDVGSSWNLVKPVPANSTLEYLLPDSPGPSNAFFRLRSAQ